MAETLTQKIGLRVRALRISKGLDADALAKRVGISSTLLTRIENGRSDMSACLLIDIAKALDCLVSVVIGEIPATEKETRRG
jgi:transcriptional regulator with XRE-family HTH domain